MLSISFFLLFRFCSGTVSYFPDIYDTLSGFPQYSHNFVFEYHRAYKNKNYIFLSLEIFRSDIRMRDVYDKSLKQWKFGRQRLRWHEIMRKLTSSVIVKIIDDALNQPTKQIIRRKKANMFLSTDHKKQSPWKPTPCLHYSHHYQKYKKVEITTILQHILILTLINNAWQNK